MLNRRGFLKTTGLMMSSLPLASAARAERRALDKPNIVFIIVDDLGQYDLSCQGGKVLRTPNIDRLASEGMRFTQAYSGCTVCAPARSTLMTGKHMGHTTVRSNTGGVSLRAEDVTVAEVLKKAGYTCGGFGKWGVGGVGTPGVPEKNGFDLFFGYYHQVHAHTYYTRYLWRNGKKVPLKGNERPEVDHRDGPAFREDKKFVGEQFSHHVIFEEVKKFIRENKDRPFFCYCPWTPPHGMYPEIKNEPAMDKFRNMPWKEEEKVYAAMVTMVDRHVGEVVALLKELGLDENTIVFFCSDNGGTTGSKKTFQSTGPLRGSKGTFYEGGLRVPFMVRWPKQVAPGQISDLQCYFPDVMPTLAELAGAKEHLPPDIDGISITPTLLGRKSEQRHREFLYWEYPKHSFSTKKYISGQLYQAVRKGKWKIVRHKTTEAFELYNLDKDIAEANDLASNNPDIVAELRAHAEASHSPFLPQNEPDLPPDRRFR